MEVDSAAALCETNCNVAWHCDGMEKLGYALASQPIRSSYAKEEKASIGKHSQISPGVLPSCQHPRGLNYFSKMRSIQLTPD